MSSFRSRIAHPWLRAAVLALAGLAAGAAHAVPSNPLGLIPDTSFNGTGYDVLPRYPTADLDSNTAVVDVIPMPHSGGYLVCTLQKVSGNTRMALARFNDQGQLLTSWGNSGQQLPGLGVPFGRPRLVLGEENGQDTFYLAFSIFSSGQFTIAVAKFLANGSFDANFGMGGFATTQLPFTQLGGVFAVGDAAFTVVNGVPMLIIMAVRNNSQFTFTRVAGSGSSTFSDDGPSALISATMYTNAKLVAHGPNHVVLVGSVDSKAWVVDYDAGNHTATQRQFYLGCGNSATPSTALEAITWPASFGGDALVQGHAFCNGAQTVVARVTGLASSPSVVWATTTDPVTDVACSSNFSPCPGAMLAYSEARPDVTITVSGSGNLIPLRLRDGKVLGSMALSDVSMDTLFSPSTQRGVVYDGSRLAGFATQKGPGLGAMYVDSLFRDTFD